MQRKLHKSCSRRGELWPNGKFIQVSTVWPLIAAIHHLNALAVECRQAKSLGVVAAFNYKEAKWTERKALYCLAYFRTSKLVWYSLFVPVMLTWSERFGFYLNYRLVTLWTSVKAGDTLSTLLCNSVQYIQLKILINETHGKVNSDWPTFWCEFLSPAHLF